MIYTIIGIIILVLVLILLSFLLIPLNLSLYLKKQGSKVVGRFTVKFLGIRFFSKEIPGEKTDEDKKEKEEKKEKDDEKDKFDLDRILKILGLFKESLPYLQRLITAFFRSFSLKKLSVDVVMGMESPADTALFTGYIWSFTYPFNAIMPFKIIITPDFQRRVFDGDFDVEVNFKLIWIVTEAIRAYTKKPVRELINEVRRG